MTENDSDIDIVRIVIIGDYLVGKTNLILSYATD
jgi:GTPase SAR1 family protein